RHCRCADSRQRGCRHLADRAVGLIAGQFRPGGGQAVARDPRPPGRLPAGPVPCEVERVLLRIRRLLCLRRIAQTSGSQGAQMSTDALELALALHQAPLQRFALRDCPLPENIGAVLQLASGTQPQLQEAAAQFSESEDTVLEAVRFFLHQVLFEPGTDAYRILGLSANADSNLIRQHHAWLQRWLHPDRRGEDWEAVFTTKVNWAWQQLRNESAREEYDRERRNAPRPQVASEAVPAAMPMPAWNAATL